MRRLLFLLFILFAIASSGQVALLDIAQDMIQKKEYKRAQEILLKAENNVHTQSEPRTYYLTAFLSKELFLTTIGRSKDSLRENVMINTAKCMALDKSKKFQSQCEQLNNFALANIFNDGIVFFNNQKYKPAIGYLEDYIRRKKTKDEHWLDAKYYIGASYFHLAQMDSAIAIFELLKRHQYDQPLLYMDLAHAYALSSSEKSLATMEEGLTRYPGNFEMQITELNLLSGAGKLAALETKLQAFLQEYPDHVDVLLMAATVYEKRRKDIPQDSVYALKIQDSYQRVLRADVDNFDANYNLGVLYYNQAVELINKQDYDIDVDKLTRILERSMRLFKESLPLLLKTHRKQTNNVQVLKALQAIYYNLNDKQQLNEITVLISKIKI